MDQITTLPSAPQLRQNNNPIQRVGSVGKINLQVPSEVDFIETFDFTLSGGTSGNGSKRYLIGDALATVSGGLGLTYNTNVFKPSNADTNAVTYAAFQEYLKMAPIWIMGINYRVTTGTSAQYNQSFRWRRIDIAGRDASKDIRFSQLQRNDQFQDTIQTAQFLTPVPLTAIDAFDITVAEGVTIVLDFILAAQVS